MNTLLALTVAVSTLHSNDPAPRIRLAPGFAQSVVVIGDEILIGRYRPTPEPPAYVGAVHVFQRSGSAWTEMGMFAAADTKLGDGFAAALASDGTLLAVGAPRGDSIGAVYLFSKSNGKWTEVGRVKLPDGQATDDFGRSVSLEGDWLLVGAPGRDSARGAVFAFRRSGGSWGSPTQLGRGTTAGDRLGASLSRSRDRVLVAAPGGVVGGGPRPPSSPPPTVRPGSAFVFRLAGEQWTEEARLTSPADSGRSFATSVALDGTRAFIASPSSNASAGEVYEFGLQGSTWTSTSKIAAQTPIPGGRFGMTVAARGSDVLVTSAGMQQERGGVHVFAKSGDGWVERQRLTSSAKYPDQFGALLTLAADVAVIAAPGADFGEGKVHLFKKSRDRWAEVAALVDKSSQPNAVTGNELKCTSGDAAGFKCQDVDLLAFLPIAAIGGVRGIDLSGIWGWTDAASNREFALVGRMDGTSFVEITNPSKPVYLGDLPLHQGARPSYWRDMKVYKNHAFIVSDGAGPHGMQIFDLTQLLKVKSPVTFQATGHYDKVASVHTIALNEETGFAYATGSNGGAQTCGGALHMIDVRNPKEPKFAGCFADPSTGYARTGYTHETQCVTYKGPDSRFTGREICINASENAIGLADVTDKEKPKAIATASYPNVSYAHQGWLSDDQRYFYLNDELDELGGHVNKTRTLVWDLAKLDEPVLAKEYVGTTGATDHNLYVKGRYVYQSNYVAGLRVLDIADPANPVEVAFFDTVKGEDVPGFDGSWTNYPFFKSGTIVLTSIREGLFIVRHRPRQPVP